MLARFDSEFKQRGTLQGASVSRSTVNLLSGLMAVLLLGWLVYRYIVQPDWLEFLPTFLSELLFLLEMAAMITLGVLAAVIFWQVRSSRQSKVLSVEEMHALGPAEFETYVAGLFRKKGYEVHHRGQRGDLGVDLELTHSSGRRAIVQCKRYSRALGPDIVRELFGTMVHERVQHGFLVTTADISKAAREWAIHKPMTLIDGQTLVQIATSLNKKTTS